MKTKTDKRILAARLSLSVTHPYFSSGLWLMRFYETEIVPTMGITKTLAVAYNPKFLDELNQDQITGVLLHELMHALRFHADRRLDRHPKLFNIAADIEINDWLIDDGFKLPDDCCFAESFEFEKHLTAEEYYELLMSNQVCPSCGKKKKSQSSSSQEEGDGQGQGDKEEQEEGDGQGQGQQDNGDGDDDYCDCDGCGCGVGQGNCGSGAGGETGEWEKDIQGEEAKMGDQQVSDVDVDLTRDEIAKAIRAYQKSTGNVPGGFVRWAEEHLGPPQVNWRKELAFRIKKAVSATRKGIDNYSYQRPSRRASLFPKIVMPSMVAAAPPSIAAIVDTSGSIADTELTAFLSEIQGILQSLGKSELRVLSCDAAVHSDTYIRKVTDLKEKILGCGGTDMREGFNALEGKDKPEIVVVFTDGYTPWPEENPVKKTIVVLSTGGDSKGVPEWAEKVELK